MEKKEKVQSTQRCPECGSPNTTKVEFECRCESKSTEDAYYQCSDCNNIFSPQNIQ